MQTAKYIFFLLLAYIINISTIYANKSSNSSFSEISQTGNPKSKLTNALDSAAAVYDKAQRIISIIERNKRIVDQLNPKLPVTLPLGIAKSVGGSDIIIALDSMDFSKEGGNLSAYALMKFPLSEDSLGFFAKNVGFNSSGFNNGRLLFIGEKSINLDAENKMALTITGARSLSYVDFDCSGYKASSLDCKITFSSDMLKPVDDVNGDGKVSTAPFTFGSDKDFENIIVSNLGLSSDFEIPSLDGFIFHVEGLAFDNSETDNPQGITFPSNYPKDRCNAEWKGLYAKEASITFPSEFKDDSGNALKIKLTNFIIDKDGISGYVEVSETDLISSGDMSGWKYSMNALKIGLSQNKPVDFEIKGDITVPMFKEGTSFSYVAQVDVEGNMFFSVEMNESMTYDFPALYSKLSLFKNSYIEIKRENGKISPKAVFNGELSISGQETKVEVANVVFSNMVIAANPFQFSIGQFALRGKSQNKLANFPITLHDVGFIKDNDYYGLDFNIQINFASENDKGFCADAGFRIKSKIELENNRFKGFNSTELKFKNFYVAANLGFINFKGELALFDHDNVYGDGFKGMLEAEFLKGLTVKSTGYFGNVNGFRYWYLDALLTLPKPIVIFPEFGIYGFGGGAYYHMVRRGPNVDLPTTNTEIIDVSATTGKSSSGAEYIPDRGILFGCKATVEIGSASSQKAFNGNGTLEFVFDDDGLRTIGLSANAYFMTEVNNRAHAGTYAELNAEMDLKNWSLYATCRAIVNIDGVLKGSNPGNVAGTLEMKFSKNRWFIYLGKPDLKNRISLTFSALANVTTQSYFVMGDSIPRLPTIKELIPEYKGSLSHSGTGGLRSITGGQGFGFGASLTASVNYKVSVLSLNGKFIVGFDVMVKNFGRSTHCEGKKAPVGINGWYAMGDAYIYASGSMKFKSFNILSLAASVVVLGQLPNPTYFVGEVTVEYDVLGGLYSGTKDFTVKLGDDCQVAIEKEVANKPIIHSFSPIDGEMDVSVTGDLKINFNQIVAKEFGSSSAKYRIDITDLKLSQEANEIEFDTVWENNNQLLIIKPKEMLAPKSKTRLSIKVVPMYYSNNSRIWKTFVDEGKELNESDVVEFFSGPNEKLEIRSDNIAYSYPMSLQTNVYLKESDLGYIKLDKPQPELFIKPNGYPDDWKHIVRFTDSNGNISEFDARVSEDSIDFPIDSKKLKTNSIYKMELLQFAEIVSSIPGQENLKKENVYYTSYFRTSIYNLFESKLNAFTKDVELVNNVYKTNVKDLNVKLAAKEFFDVCEIIGKNGKRPLVECEFVTTNNIWLSDLQKIFFDANTTFNPMFNSIEIKTDGEIDGLSQSEARLGIFYYKTQMQSLDFDGDLICYGLYKVAQSSANNIMGDYKHIGKQGNKYAFSYYLPGKKDPVKTIEIEIK